MVFVSDFSVEEMAQCCAASHKQCRCEGIRNMTVTWLSF